MTTYSHNQQATLEEAYEVQRRVKKHKQDDYPSGDTED